MAKKDERGIRKEQAECIIAILKIKQNERIKAKINKNYFKYN